MREPRLWDGMIIVSWFWLVGAVVLSLLPALVKDIVGGSEGVVTLCLAVFAIGIAVGSLFAAQLSHVRPNLALVPIGAIIMGIVGLDLALRDLADRARHRCLADGLRNVVRGVADAGRLRGVRLRRRTVRGAVFRRGPGLVGALRTRPRDCRRQCAAGGLHGGGLDLRRGVAGRKVFR